MSNPYISVIIPVYNRTQYVGEAINSVLNQTLDMDKYEIIVVTNIDLPEREGVRIIKSKDLTLGGKIVEGILNSQGEVISLLEDDDLFLPNKLEVVYKVFKADDRLGLFKNPIKYINDRGKEWLGSIPKEPIVITPKDLNIDLINEIFEKYEIASNNSSLSFRKRDIIRYLNYLREIKLVSDCFIGLLFLFTNKVMIWNQPLTLYRIWSGNASRKLTNLDEFIQNRRFFWRISIEDCVTTYKALKNSGFEELVMKHINYMKINIKLWSKNSNEIKLTLKDVLNAAPLGNSKYSTGLKILAYLASFLPYSLKKQIIYKRHYKLELKKYKII
mgnify:CR=1 FL=1